MGGLTPPSYAVAHDDNSRNGTPGPAGVGAIAARMFSGLGEYVSFGANSTAATAGHQVRVSEFSSRLRLVHFPYKLTCNYQIAPSTKGHKNLRHPSLNQPYCSMTFTTD